MARIAGNTRAPKGLSSDRREGFVRAAVKLLRRKGPLPTPDLLALLCAQGISTTEALSVVNLGFSNQLLMRDPRDPAGIAAGPASLPTPSRTATSPVLQTASTRPVDKRRSHRKKVASGSEPRV
jgi:hypothetical protein